MKGKKQKEPVGFNPAEIFAALALLEKERGIPQSFMMEKIVQALTTAYKRDHADVENVIVDVDEEHQNLKMFVQKNVVEEEDYVDPANEMPIEEAKKLSAKYEVGDIVNIPVDTVEFGRIAAGNGKQVIIQGLREAERGMVYDEFNSKQHEILTGVVTRIDPRNGNVSLRIGTGTDSTEALLMAGEQVPGEELTEGMQALSDGLSSFEITPQQQAMIASLATMETDDPDAQLMQALLNQFLPMLDSLDTLKEGVAQLNDGLNQYVGGINGAMESLLRETEAPRSFAGAESTDSIQFVLRVPAQSLPVEAEEPAAEEEEQTVWERITGLFGG